MDLKCYASLVRCTLTTILLYVFYKYYGVLHLDEHFMK